MQQLELAPPGAIRPTIREVDDFALMESVDCRVRLVDETLQSFAQPMIAASRPACVVHALLDHRPAAVIGDDEAVQVEVKAVLDGGAVDLRHQPAETGERRSVESRSLADRNQFVGRFARMLASAAADMDAEFARQRLEDRASARR